MGSIVHQFVDTVGDLVFGKPQGFQNNTYIFLDGKFFKNRGFLRKIGNPFLCSHVNGKLRDFLTVEQDPATIRTNKTGDGVKRGGFSGTIWPQKTNHSTSVNLETYSVNYCAISVTFNYLIYFKLCHCKLMVSE